MVFYKKSYITNIKLINMKLENYTTSKIFLFAVLLFVSCNGTNDKNGNASITESTNQISKLGSDVFDLPDSVLITSKGKVGKMCVAISKNADSSNFSMVMTKSTHNGILTPSVKGNNLCLEYAPKADFWGLDSLDCKICFISTGLCQEKTWRIEVKNTPIEAKSETKTNKIETKTVTVVEKISSKSPPKSPRSSTKSKDEPRVILSPTIQSSSSIFDENQKNTDGYIPKN